MTRFKINYKLIFLITGTIVLFIGIICLLGQPIITELTFAPQSADLGPDQQTINSIQKIGNLYTVQYYGEYEERLQWLNDFHVKGFANTDSAAHCSLFAAYTKNNEPLLGRNFDRLHEYPVLTKFSAPGKYASFAFSPASEVYLKEVFEATAPSEEIKNMFLFCLPYYVTDGINEKGLSIALAGAPPRQVKQNESSKPMFVLLFIRRVLDQCKNIEEVIQFVKTLSLYDSDLGTISHHFVVVDASGKWLVIDYPDGELRLSTGQGEPQFRTNHFLEGGPAIDNTSFQRYKKLSGAFSSSPSFDSDLAAMELLKGVKHDTKWSVVYEPAKGSGLIAAHEKYNKLYRFGFTKDQFIN